MDESDESNTVTFNGANNTIANFEYNYEKDEKICMLNNEVIICEEMGF